MKGVKGASFGVRFYRRADGKPTKTVKDKAPEIANAESDAPPSVAMEIDVVMTDIPPQNAVFTMKRDADASVKATNPQKTQAASQTQVKERALFAAAKAGDCGRIRLLVMDGVDLDVRDGQGRTAINIATQYNKQDALKTLLAAREMRRMAKLGELPQSKFYKKFDQKKNKSA